MVAAKTPVALRAARSPRRVRAPRLRSAAALLLEPRRSRELRGPACDDMRRLAGRRVAPLAASAHVTPNLPKPPDRDATSWREFAAVAANAAWTARRACSLARPASDATFLRGPAWSSRCFVVLALMMGHTKPGVGRHLSPVEHDHADQSRDGRCSASLQIGRGGGASRGTDLGWWAVPRRCTRSVPGRPTSPSRPDTTSAAVVTRPRCSASRALAGRPGRRHSPATAQARGTETAARARSRLKRSIQQHVGETR